MSSIPGGRAMRGRQRKTPGGSSRDMRDEAADAAGAAVPEPRLARPSWRWRLLLCVAVVGAVIGMTAAVVPELFLSAVQATAPHAHP